LLLEGEKGIGSIDECGMSADDEHAQLSIASAVSQFTQKRYKRNGSKGDIKIKVVLYQRKKFQRRTDNTYIFSQFIRSSRVHRCCIFTSTTAIIMVRLTVPFHAEKGQRIASH
jgi:hypothetical protein